MRLPRAQRRSEAQDKLQDPAYTPPRSEVSSELLAAFNIDAADMAEMNKATSYRAGEDRLLFAILEDAIWTVKNAKRSKEGKLHRAVVNARRWLASDDEGIFHFVTICEHLKLNPSWIRKRIKAFVRKDKVHHASSRMTWNYNQMNKEAQVG